MKKTSRLISLIIVLSMLVTLIPAAVFADEDLYAYFDDATVSNTLSEMEMFYLGSTNMTVSEKSDKKYLMKVGRGGSLEGDADVTVKFMDITAKYGENYKVYPYDEASGTVTDESGFTVAEFINEAGDNYIERNEEDIAAISEYAQENGVNILDKNGEIVASTVPQEDGYSILNGGGEEVIKYSENGESSETATATLDEVIENSDEEITQEEINQAENDMLTDDFPGVEITLHFASGENEKLIVVEPLYSEKAEGDAIASVVLKNATGNMSIPEDNGLGLCIKDEDESEEAVVSLAQSEYTADGDSIDVEIKRQGRLNDLVSVHVCTYSVDGGKAEMGKDFQGYSAEVQFAPGMESRTVPIQIRHLTTADSEFKVCITNPVACKIENGEAIVHITPKEPEINKESGINKEESNVITLDEDGNVVSGEGVSLAEGEGESNDAIKFDTNFSFDDESRDRECERIMGTAKTQRYGRDCFLMSGKGMRYNEWSGVGFITDEKRSKYLYDGIEFEWETYWVRGSWFKNQIRTYERGYDDETRHFVYATENEPNEYKIYTKRVLFDRPLNRVIMFTSTTTSGRNFYNALYRVTPILRNYRFELINPDNYLTFENVPEWESKVWQSAKYDQLSDSDSVFEGTLDDSFTVTKKSTPGNYAHLSALRIVVNGTEVAHIDNNTNTEAITVKLDRNLMNQIADRATYIGRSTSIGKRFVGYGIKVIPEYTYSRAATVRVQARDNDYGYLKVFRNSQWQTITRTTDINMHAGDRLRVFSEVKDEYKGYYIPWGTHYQNCNNNWEPLPGFGTKGLMKYDNGAQWQDFKIEENKVILNPGFTESGNCVKVKVKNENVSLFDQTEGIFKYHEGAVEEKNGYKYYDVSGLVGTGAFVTMSAQSEATDEADKVTPVWYVDGKYYFGSTFYYIAQETKEQNEIELIPQKNAEIKTANGKLFFEDKNIKTKYVSKIPLMPCSNAIIVGGDYDALAEQDGRFSLDFRMFGKNAISSGGIGAKGEQCFTRFIVYTGTNYAIRDVQIAGNSLGASLKTIDVGNINLEVNNTNAPYIETVDAYQAGLHITETNTVVMRGTGLDLYATVRDGQKYYDAQGKELTERVTGVKFYVVDSKMRKVKSTYDAKMENREGDITKWKMSIDSFSPDNPEAYTFGDVFYVSVTTDRPMMADKSGKEPLPDRFGKTTYPMVSTGLQIVEMKDYKPGTISMDISLTPSEKENGEEGDDNAAYESLPFVGGMTAMMQFAANKTAIAALNKKFSKVDPYGALSMIIKFSNLPYGGTRFQIGMSVVHGNKAWQNGATMDSFKDLSNWKQYLDGNLPKYVFNDPTGMGMRSNINEEYQKMNKYASSTGRFGNLRMNFSVGIGAYIDFGNIKGEDYHYPVFIGAGAFLCISGGVEWIWPVLIPPFKIPGYVGFEGSASFDGFLGAERDPANLIRYDEFRNIPDTDLNQFKFAPNILLSFGVKGFVGVGIANFIGGRISIGFSADFIYSENLRKYFKAITSKTGWEVKFLVGGQIDFFGIPIKFNVLSVPLRTTGIYRYYTTLGRVQKLTNYMKKSMEPGGLGYNLSQSIKDQANDHIKKLENDVKTNEKDVVLNAHYDDAYDYARHNNMLTGKQIASLSVTLNFIPSSADDYEPAEDGVRLKHVESQWIGSKAKDVFDINDNGLGVLQENSVNQPYMDIISLGKGDDGHEKMLAIFLNDTSNEGEDMKTDVYYTVYDNEDKTWQEPKSLVETNTVKYFPKIVVAGENVILAWSEFTPVEEIAANDDPIGLLNGIDVVLTVVKKSDILNNNGVANSEIHMITDDDYLSYPIDMDYNETTGDTTILYSTNPTMDGNIEDYVDTTKNEFYYVIIDGENGAFGESKKIEKLSDLPVMGVTMGDDISGDDIFLEVVSNDTEFTDDTSFDLMAYLRDENGNISSSIILDSGVYAYGKPHIITVDTPHEYHHDEKPAEDYDKTTYLFWHDKDNHLKYINLSYLKEDGCFESGEFNAEEAPIFNVDSIYDENKIAMMDEKIVTDSNGNVILLYTRSCVDEETAYDLSVPPAREVYAMTLIDPKEENPNLNAAKAWSKPYKITNDGKCADGLNAIVGDDGKIYVTYNQFSMINTGTPEEPSFDVGPTNLMFTSFTPTAKIEASDFEFSDEHINAGDTVHVKATLENTGLAPAKGFKAVFYECKDGVPGNVIDTLNFEETLAPSRMTEHEFDWNVPGDFESGSICCIATETNTNEETRSESEKLDNAPDLELYVGDLSQNGDKFRALCFIENNGGSVNKGYKMEVKFKGLYGEYFSRYGLDTDILAEVEVPEVATGEMECIEVEFAVPAQAFEYCGYDAAIFTIYTSDNNMVTSDENFLVLDEYIEFELNGGEDLVLTVGSTKDISDVGDSDFIRGDDEIIYFTEDPTIAIASADGKVTGVREGNTKVTATSSSTGMSDTINVTVKKKGSGGGSGGSGSGIGIADYSIKVNDSENGTITADKKTAPAGATVTLATKPDEGASLEVIAVCDPDGNEIELTSLGDGKYSFKMPKSDVTVNAIFIGGKSESGFFTDVKETDWFYDAVKYVFDNKLMNGTGDKTFEPLSEVTRGMFATVLYRLDGEPAFMNDNVFDDVISGEYYEKAVVWAQGKDIVNGTTETTFEPDKAITREEMAAMLYRYIQHKGGGFTGAWAFPLDFKDADQVSDWAYEPMCYLTMPSVGLINGMEDGSLAPKNNTNRAEIATILTRFNQLDK